MTHRMRLSIADEMLALNGLPGTIGVAAVFAGEPPEIAELRDRVEQRWGPLPRMSRALVPAPGRGRTVRHTLFLPHRWVDAGGFDPAEHVVTSDDGLEELIAAGVRAPLSTRVPPWRLHLVRSAPYGGDFGLVLLADHCLLDGRSLETLLRMLMDGAASGRPPRPALVQAPQPPVAKGAVRGELRSMLGPGQALPCPRQGDVQPSAAVRALSPQVMRAARRVPADGRGATLNELLVGAVAGALRSRYGPPPNWPAPAPVHAAVPVDLRTRHKAQELGNVVSAVRLPLPLELDDPAERLLECQRLAAAVPARRDAHAALFPVFQSATRMGPWVAKLLAARGHSAAYTPAICTAFKWRDHPSALHGRPLLRVVGVSPLHSPGTANFSLVQTGNAFTLTSVAHLGPDGARLLADAVADELAALAEIAGWSPAQEPAENAGEYVTVRQAVMNE